MSKAQDSEQQYALLVVFGNIDFLPKKLAGDAVYDYLTSRDAWFVPRQPHGMVVGMAILFYQSGVGFRGTATIDSIAASSGADRKEFGLIPLDLYPTKIEIRDLRTFPDPIDPRPLLQRISFVSNKTYWGHSFRYSPRLIPRADFDLIVGSLAAHGQ